MSPYLFRRHRRPLLFPPGLLALAGLLWVGCVVVGKWEEQLKPKRVLQLTMMPLHPRQGSFQHGLNIHFDSLVTNGLWSDTQFTGKPGVDKTEENRVINALNIRSVNTQHSGGVRVHFAPTSHYEQLVFMLELMNRNSIMKYAFDIRKGASIFYIFTKTHGQIKADDEFIVIMKPSKHFVPYSPPPPPFWVSFRHQVATSLHSLLQPEWRVSMWLLAAIAALGSWRMLRPRYIV